MASTTRKKRTTTKKKSSTKKKVFKKTATKKPDLVPEFPTHLSETDLRILEVYGAEAEAAKMRMAVEEQLLANYQLEMVNLKFKIESQKSIIANRQKAYENKTKKYIDFKKETWPKYGYNVNEAFSYNPETGEIIRA